MKALLASLLALSMLSSCAPNEASAVDAEPDWSNEVDAVTGELKASVPSLTVWLRPTLTPEQRDGRLVYVLRGRASQNLEGVNSFVFDDPFGNAATLSARTFEVVFDANSELNSAAAGLRVFIAVRPANTAVAPATASITLQPAFSAPSGSTSVFVRGDVWPLAIGDTLTYRAIVRTTGGAPLTVTTADGANLPVAKRSADEWNVDFPFPALRAATDVTGEQITFRASSATGVKQKKAQLAVGVKTLSLTRGDVYEVFPPLQCAATVQACLDALPAGQLDSEACGTWYPVTRCQLPWRQVSMFASPDDLTALTTARNQVQAQLPADKQISFRAFGVMEDVSPANLSRVVTAWKAFDPSAADLIDTGDVTATQVRAELQAFGNAQPMVTAAQQVVLQQSFVARRFVRGQASQVYVLFFSSAHRVVVLETNTLLP